MKQQVPPAAIVALIVVILAIVGFIGYKSLAPDTSKVQNAATGMSADQKAQYEAAQAKGSQQSGQSNYGSSSGYPGSNSGH
ncbi:MAG: hypothetical protein JWL77_5587 [Chthonomonadaceae bacterium]|nr:hypothetical protein [Chthonomonadaceae bacterium]